jgi:hypothetical protein
MNQSNQFKLYGNAGDMTSGSYVIPRELAKQQGHNFENTANLTLTRQLLIDSASRNWDTQESNQYTIYLGEELKYVTSIELIDGRIPNSSYMITTQNNLLHFQETKAQVNMHTYYTAEIPFGNYSIHDLMNQIKVSMHKASSSKSKYHCSVDSASHRITISTDDAQATKIFNLIFTDGNEIIGDRGYIETQVIDPVTDRKEIRKVETGNFRSRYIAQSIGQVLGFKAQNLCGSKKYTGQMVYRLRSNNYLALYINTENSDDFKNVIAPSPDNGANHSFAIIQVDNDGEYFDLSADRLHISENAHLIREFNPPINFSTFKVAFKTPNGNLYDFNGLDHYLLFEIKQVYDRSTLSK